MNDDEYYLYSVSVYESNQNVVLVDNKKSKELGFYDLKNKIGLFCNIEGKCVIHYTFS